MEGLGKTNPSLLFSTRDGHKIWMGVLTKYRAFCYFSPRLDLAIFVKFQEGTRHI
jgi:hypothetical protein